MAQATLDHVLEEVMSLEPDEMRQVQQAIQKHLAPSDYSPEEKKVLSEYARSWSAYGDQAATHHASR